MAYRRSSQLKKRSIDEICGNETYTDSRGRVWKIKVFTIGSLHIISDAFGKLSANSFSPLSQAAFISSMLLDPDPDWRIRVRRLLGLPDYSAKEMAGMFYHKDVDKVIDAICRANYDKGLQQILDDAKKVAESEFEKKKMMEISE